MEGACRDPDLIPCLSLLSIVVIKAMTESSLREGFLFQQMLCSQFITKGSQGKYLDAGAHAEAMEEHRLQLCSSWLGQPAFLNNPGPTAIVDCASPHWLLIT